MVKYIATVGYEKNRGINPAEVDNLNRIAEKYQGSGFVSNVNNGLIAFIFRDEKSREEFAKESRQLKDVLDINLGQLQ